MPNLSELKKFSSDMKSLGREAIVRKKRGQRMPQVPLPQGLSDEDSSEDSNNEVYNKLLGNFQDDVDDETANPTANNDLPDLDALADFDTDLGGTEEIVKGPTPPSEDSSSSEDASSIKDALADFDTSDLDLGEQEGANNGGNNSSIEKSDKENESAQNDFNLDDIPQIDDSKNATSSPDSLGDLDLPDLSELDNLGKENNTEKNTPSSTDDLDKEGAKETEKSEGAGDLGGLDELKSENTVESSKTSEAGDLDDLDLSDLGDEGASATEGSVGENNPSGTEDLDLSDLDNLGDLGDLNKTDEKKAEGSKGADDLDLSDLDNLGSEGASEGEGGVSENNPSGTEDLDLSDLDNLDTEGASATEAGAKSGNESGADGLEDLDLSNLDDLKSADDLGKASEADDLDLSDLDNLGSEGTNANEEGASENNPSGTQDLDLSDLDNLGSEGASEGEGGVSENNPSGTEDLDLSDLDNLDNLDKGDTKGDKEAKEGEGADDLGLDGADDLGEAKTDSQTQSATAPKKQAPSGADGADFDSLNFEDIPDAGINIPKTVGEEEAIGKTDIPEGDDEEDESESDFESEQVNFEGSEGDGGAQDEGEASSEALPDLDGEGLGGAEQAAFESITQNAAEEAKSAQDDFEIIEDKDKIKNETDGFEIPGYSDAADSNEAQQKAEDEKKSSENSEDISQLPPNALTDEEYDKFKENFDTYPLNVRTAIEELFSKDEFNDDVEFDIVKRILRQESARKVASELEKLLDVALPVPKDFEKRSTAQYDQYKASFEYQLKNRIIPGAALCAAAAVICYLLFLFGKNCIYNPVKANSIYSEGYDYLQSSNYEASEQKFLEAINYSLQKKWFLKYAEGYRLRKQYLRAQKMYNNTLKLFNHDKSAGLQWAQMESLDLANYEKAEKILYREVLDYHVNDKDALLALADNYLEWATEKDPAKFESARLQYMDLMDLYGKKEKLQDIYLGRMMKYFMRTNNLQKVLEIKPRFMPKEKERTLNGEEWTELGAFLLDKLYGPLDPGDEYLRAKIEDVKEVLTRSLKANETNPLALHNMARYYLQMHDDTLAKRYLERTIGSFDKAAVIKKRDMYKYIDSYRLLGELYTEDKEFLLAQESYTKGISLFTKENEESGLTGNKNIGKLYCNMADIDYFISGNNEGALLNYEDALKNKYDTPQIRYKIGALLYNKSDYNNALSSFMKAVETNPDDESILLAMANTLSLRGDDYLAQGYYEHLVETLDNSKEQKGVLFPQMHKEDSAMMEFYLKACNNLGVTLYRIAQISGNSSLNARSIINLQQSLRAWDALTRNQTSMVRMGGSNLAEENIRYITKPVSDFQPAIYIDIPRALESDEGLSQ